MTDKSKKLSIKELTQWCYDEDVNFYLYYLEEGYKALLIQCSGIKNNRETIVYRMFVARDDACTKITKIMNIDKYNTYHKIHKKELEDLNTAGGPVPLKILSRLIEKTIDVDINSYTSLIKYLELNRVCYITFENILTRELNVVVRANKYTIKIFRYRLTGPTGKNAIFDSIIRADIGLSFDDLRFSNSDDNCINVKVYNYGSKRTATQLIYI
jgi:hypothetical protein